MKKYTSSVHMDNDFYLLYALSTKYVERSIIELEIF